MNGKRIVLSPRRILSFPLLHFWERPRKRRRLEKAERKGQDRKGFGFTTSRAPIDITSDTVEEIRKQNTVTFKGNVVAKQEDTTLYANMLVIYYDPETKKLKEIVATGNVKIVQFERRATSQKAIFYQDENKVVLDGDAVVREGENVIRGERMIFYLDEETKHCGRREGESGQHHDYPTQKGMTN